MVWLGFMRYMNRAFPTAKKGTDNNYMTTTQLEKPMNRRSFLKQTIASGISSLFAPAILNEAVAAQTQKPNIVFFFVDDMGWQDTSEPFHIEMTELNLRYITPNMERLADEGLKFSQAYACSVCSPSLLSSDGSRRPR